MYLHLYNIYNIFMKLNRFLNSSETVYGINPSDNCTTGSTQKRLQLGNLLLFNKWNCNVFFNRIIVPLGIHKKVYNWVIFFLHLQFVSSLLFIVCWCPVSNSQSYWDINQTKYVVVKLEPYLTVSQTLSFWREALIHNV